MSSPRVIGLVALILSGAAAFPAGAEDGPPASSADRPGETREAQASRERASDSPRGQPDIGLEQARAAAESHDDDLDRARAAARAAASPDDDRSRGNDASRESADPSGAKDCLSARAARGAIGAKRAVTLSQALQAARQAWDGEVIDYKLCTFDGKLAYELTVLNADGRVARVRVGAVDGKLVNVR